VDQDHKANLDKLGGLSGTDFDSNYAAMQVKAHEDAIALFEDYAKSGDNTDLKQWAQKTLPTLKEHLDHAKKLASNQKRAGL
jgi:putative membrane protein